MHTFIAECLKDGTAHTSLHHICLQHVQLQLFWKQQPSRCCSISTLICTVEDIFRQDREYSSRLVRSCQRCDAL